MKITAKTIRNVIACKHSKDLIVPECKTGPTWFNDNLRKLDVWILRRSWTQFATIGYEIKISRSDFLRDKKWPEYLQYCHEFSFVCPWGIINPEEITDSSVGLYWISKNGKRLFIQRKAEHREIELPDLLIYHILMSRVVVIRPYDIWKIRSERDQLKKEMEDLKKEMNL